MDALAKIPDYKQLEIIQAYVETRNYSETARRTGVSQARVRMVLKQSEKRITELEGILSEEASKAFENKEKHIIAHVARVAEWASFMASQEIQGVDPSERTADGSTREVDVLKVKRLMEIAAKAIEVSLQLSGRPLKNVKLTVDAQQVRTVREQVKKELQFEVLDENGNPLNIDVSNGLVN